MATIYMGDDGAALWKVIAPQWWWVHFHVHVTLERGAFLPDFGSDVVIWFSFAYAGNVPTQIVGWLL